MPVSLHLTLDLRAAAARQHLQVDRGRRRAAGAVDRRQGRAETVHGVAYRVEPGSTRPPAKDVRLTAGELYD
jgi:hypothetical protein